MTKDSAHSFYQIIDHTADLGIIVRGPDVNRLFINAANAMIDLMIKRNRGNAQVFRDILIDAADFSDLMVRWLGEILYLFAAEKLIAHIIEIKTISPIKLEAALSFAIFEPERHQVLREIKAVTYHQISVREVNDEWEARVIFDI